VKTVETSTNVVVALDRVRHTPLNQIRAHQANAIVRHVVNRNDDDLRTVEVARFGSSI